MFLRLQLNLRDGYRKALHGSLALAWFALCPLRAVSGTGGGGQLTNQSFIGRIKDNDIIFLHSLLPTWLHP